MKLKAIFSAVLLILLSATSGYAQFSHHYYGGGMSDYDRSVKGGYQKYMQRSTLGYYIRFANAELTAHYRDGLNGKPSFFRHVDTTTTLKLKSVGSWGAFEESYIPIAGLDENSVMGLDLGAFGEFTTFKAGGFAPIPGEAAFTDDVNAITIGLLIGIDYRVGGDAVLDKSKRGMFNIGAGFSPSAMALSYNPLNEVVPPMQFKMIPYLKAEVGFFLGIGFKLRGEMLFGKMNYFDVTGKDEDSQLDISMKSKITGFRLSLGLMPYSWHWGEDD
jgi:hypothetical protein